MLLFLSAPTFAQTPTDPAPLTEIEKLKLENLALTFRMNEMTKEIGQWRTVAAQCLVPLSQYESKAGDEQAKANLDKLVAEVEAARPGFTFNPQTGAFTKKPE